MGIFKNMGGNIPGRNFPGGSLMGGNFPSGSFPDTVILVLDCIRCIKCIACIKFALPRSPYAFRFQLESGFLKSY